MSLPDKDYLRPDEVADVMRRSRSTIYRMIDNGDMPAYKPKNRRGLLIKREDVIKAIECERGTE